MCIYLSYPRTGAATAKLLRTTCRPIIIHQTLLCFKLDYDFFHILVQASSTFIPQTLDIVQTSSLPFMTRAFRTSPAVNLCAEVGRSPLSYRRLTLSAKLLLANSALMVYELIQNHVQAYPTNQHISPFAFI